MSGKRRSAATSRAERHTGPLAGVRVVDLTAALAGPYATLMLADAGAEVLKIERPDQGDATRGWGPPFVGPAGRKESVYFLSVNRAKRSVALDLKSARDVAVLKELIRRADVLAENYRPGVMERLGLGDDSLAQLNPRLVVLSITGFGEGGPDGDRPGFDQIVLGEAGIMSITGFSDGPPLKMGLPIGDILAGMFGAFGVVSALLERERSGEGQWVRVSLLSGLIAIHTFQGTRWLIAGEVPRRDGNRHPIINPYGTYDCADEPINIAVGSEGLWHRFAPLVGIDPDDPRFATNEQRVHRADELERCLAPALRSATAAEWLERLAAAGVPAGRIRTIDQVYKWEQVSHLGLIDTMEHPTLGKIRLPGPPVSFSRSGRRPAEAPPLLGEDTAAVLKEIGWEEE